MGVMEKVTCPHCGVAFVGRKHSATAATWLCEALSCVECRGWMVWISRRDEVQDENDPNVVRMVTREPRFLAFPRSSSRQAPPEVPGAIAADYHEASLVLPFSPKASAALSRRCLQHVLHHHGIRKRNLQDEIDEAAASPGFPPTVADMLHTIREVGNVAAHPKKEQATGIIVDVEDGEAELLLEVLQDLFDHYFVKPARHAAKKAAIAAKLAAARGQAPPAPGAPAP